MSTRIMPNNRLLDPVKTKISKKEVVKSKKPQQILWGNVSVKQQKK